MAYLGFHFGGGGSKYFRKSGGIFSKKIAKIFIFYIKIIDKVLLCTIFRGSGAYSLDFLSIVQRSEFWRKFSVNFLLRKYIIPK